MGIILSNLHWNSISSVHFSITWKLLSKGMHLISGLQNYAWNFLL